MLPARAQSAEETEAGRGCFLLARPLLEVGAHTTGEAASRVFVFRLYFFSLQSETKRTEIRFACISLVRFEVFASLFSKYSHIFT